MSGSWIRKSRDVVRELYEKARAGGYALGQFNAENLEYAQAILTAASAAKSPVVVAASPKTLRYMTARQFVAMVRAVSEDVDVPAMLHLDHGETPEMVRECIDAGFDSVMFDGSRFEYDENVARTKEAARIARDSDVFIEGELGHVAGKEEDEGKSAPLTDPDEAAKFAGETGVDSLAIAVGTSHGAYKYAGAAQLNLDRIEAIRKAVDIPLVLHGASGVDREDLETIERYGGRLPGASGLPDEHVQAAIRAGISKVNVATELRLAFLASLRKSFAEQPGVIDPRVYLGEARSAIQRAVENKLNVLGSVGAGVVPGTRQAGSGNG